MLSRMLLFVGLVAAGLLLFIMTSISPGSAGAPGILAVFVLSYVVLLCLFTFLIWGFLKVIEKIGRNLTLFRNISRVSLWKAYYYSSVVSLGIIIVISLRSVGGIGFYELGLVSFFVLLGCMYVARMTR